MVLCSFRIPVKVKELWQAAAAQEEISQSEFLRKAIRYRAKQVLLAEARSESSMSIGEANAT